MSRWRAESGYVGRYIGSGWLNTAVGFSVIFLSMWMGNSPIVSNVAGYAVGLFLGFIFARSFVFRSTGTPASEGLRYIGAFLASFFINLSILTVMHKIFHWDPVVSQLFAAAGYTASMYAFSRWLVFSPATYSADQDR